MARRLPVICLAFATAAALGAASAGAKPRLQLLDRDPLVVRGVGFNARGRVVATAVTLAGPHVVRTRANARGTVVVRFRALTTDPCSGAFVVRLKGASGALAALKLSLRECPQLDMP